MKTANIASESLRTSETGFVWEEQLSGATGSLELLPMATFRVRGSAGTVVTIDGIKAMTMAAGEIAIFCAGNGSPDDAKSTVTVAITVAAAFVQVARDKDRDRLQINPFNRLDSLDGTTPV
jgi:hypothetical protein